MRTSCACCSTEGDDVTFDATALDPSDGDLSANLSWSSSQDGALGTGTGVVAPLSAGIHVITATANDSGGLPSSDQITLTVTNVAPTVTITTPTDGISVTEADSVAFAATALDPGEGDFSANVTWTSNQDGALGTGASLVRSNLSVGVHVITASVSDSGGLPASDPITLTITNVAPTVAITTPTDGASLPQGAVTLTATATDPGQGDLSENVSWSSDQDGPLGTGASIVQLGLSLGPHVITASVTDGELPASHQITLIVTNLSVGVPSLTDWGRVILALTVLGLGMLVLVGRRSAAG